MLSGAKQSKVKETAIEDFFAMWKELYVHGVGLTRILYLYVHSEHLFMNIEHKEAGIFPNSKL